MGGPGDGRVLPSAGSLGRLILFDKRDTGLSDRAPQESTLEERIEDVQAVMSAASSRRAVCSATPRGRR